MNVTKYYYKQKINKDPVNRSDKWLIGAVPKDRRESYEIRPIIESVTDKDSFFEMAKTVQDTYSGGSLQGELYALTKLKAHIQSQIEDVQDRINKTPVGKILNDLTQSK